jgi:hypothetical protein
VAETMRVVKDSLNTETHRRPYQDDSIDELFEEIVLDSAHAKGLLDFSLGIYNDDDAKIDVSAIRAFLQSVNERVQNVNGGLPVMINELKQREKDWQTVQRKKGR